MNQMITTNKTLNFFSALKTHIGSCCFLVMLLLMSGTGWAQTPGEVCEGPIIISGLPFLTTDNTENYGDDYSSSDRPPLATGAIGNPSSSYLGGNDVVYAYTPTSNENITVTVTEHGSWAGLFVFTGCPFSSTVGGQSSSSASTILSVENLPVMAGETYYFVISTWPTPDSTPYTLNIESFDFDCVDLDVNFGAPCTLDTGGPGEIDENCECVELICQNSSKYPSNVITPDQSGSATGISTCQYWTEYSEIGGVISGNEYIFTSVKGDVNGFITLREGAVDGPVVASGISPLTITASSNSNLFAHWTLNDACLTETGCAITEVSCVSCANQPDCEGVLGGPAQPGTACDDANPGTVGEVYDADCNCGGGIAVAQNDEACNAAILACGDTLVQSMAGSTASIIDDCFGSGAADVWFTFATNGSQMVTVGEGGGDYFDAVVQLFKSDDCENLVEVGACADSPENFTVTEAGNYYFRVRPYYSSGESDPISVYLICEDYDCPNQSANIGDACDDGDPETVDDVIDENCGCAGEAPLLECTNTSSYGSANVNTPDTITISTCQFFSEYSTISGVNAGYEYEFSGVKNSDNSLAYITVRSDSSNGPVVGYGISPLTVTAPSNANLYVHWNTDNNCGTGSGCATTKAICVTCADVIDCEGVAGGSALPGTSCDDGDNTTVNDVYDADCNCAGEPATEASICSTAIPVVCNAEPATYSSEESNGVNTTSCFMGDKGLWFSFMGTGGDITVNSSASFDHRLSVNSGSCDDLSNIVCQDGSVGAENYTISSSVEGLMYYVYIARYNSGSTTTGDITIAINCAEVFDCPQYEANIGDSCDDGDDSTENDILDENCGCAGTPIIVFDCPQIEANIGDSCDDGDDSTENDVVDANCGCAGTPIIVFDCPQIEANIGDPCDDGDDSTENDVVDANCGCAGTPVVTPTCDDFVYYLSDHAAADGISDIYKVTVSGGIATMEYLATSDIEVHIAYNSVDNLLYAVSKHTNSYRTLNPHVIAPSFGPTVSLGADYGELTAAVFNVDGKLLIGSQNNNAIYTVSLPNTVSPYDAYSPVTGGDLAFGSDGMLYLATRSGNGLYENYPAPVFDNLIGSVPAKVTGLAITDTDNLLVSAQGQSSLQLYSSGGSNIGSYALELDGEPYILRDGDMASGCNTFDQPVDGECLNYKLYYIHSPQGGGQQPLLEVTLNGDGTASYATVLANIGGHIGLSPDGGIIYNVNSKLKVIDVASATVIATMNITTAGGSVLSGFPAALVGADGTLYVGHSSSNQVYTVDPSTGIATPYGPGRTVQGGDLIEVNGEIWIITRNNNTFTNVMTGDSFTVSVNEINGAAVLSNGNVLLADGNGGSLLKEVEIASQSVVATYDIALPLHNGDLAGGCIDAGGLNTQCYGAEVLDFNQGVQTNGSAVPADRSDATAALGEPDRSNAPGGFVSLGVGGSITIGFAGVIYDAPGNDIRIWETSFSGDVCGGSDDESADIELSQDGINFVSVGSICRDGEVDIDGSGLDYVSAIRITNSASTGSLDGYDVDGVEAINGCSEEPLIEDGDCYATEVVEYVQGTSSNGGAIAANRTDASQALGAPERVDQLVFVSLGYGGSLTLAFDGAVPNGPGDDIEIVETTYGNASCASYAEFADVYVSVDGINFIFAKTVCRADGFVDIDDADPSLTYVNYVKVVNNNDLSTTPDAFDVDGVVALYNCEEEPVTPGLITVTESELSSFPNPTAGVSQVVFVTAETGRTLVEVYDMSGRNIATLFNAEAQNGKEYTLDFDGAALPNGVYIYKMTTNNETIIEKFMIAK